MAAVRARLPISRVPASFASYLNQVYAASRMGDAHAAVIAWCRANGRALTGTRWEIYGHWSDDPARVRTDVFYLLKPSV
jgi:hypothetical protein